MHSEELLVYVLDTQYVSHKITQRCNFVTPKHKRGGNGAVKGGMKKDLKFTTDTNLWHRDSLKHQKRKQ